MTSDLPEGMLEKGVAWLTAYQDKQTRLLENKASEIKPNKSSADDLDALVFMVLCDAGVRNDRMIGFLDRDRTHLSVYAKTMLGLGLERIGDKARAGLRASEHQPVCRSRRREPDRVT